MGDDRIGKKNSLGGGIEKRVNGDCYVTRKSKKGSFRYFIFTSSARFSNKNVYGGKLGEKTDRD